jgi:hypothetical protein
MHYPEGLPRKSASDVYLDPYNIDDCEYRIKINSDGDVVHYLQPIAIRPSNNEHNSLKAGAISFKVPRGVYGFNSHNVDYQLTLDFSPHIIKTCDKTSACKVDLVVHGIYIGHEKQFTNTKLSVSELTLEARCYTPKLE